LIEDAHEATELHYVHGRRGGVAARGAGAAAFGDARAGCSPSTSPSLLGSTFLQGLREEGYVEGQNILIEYRSPEGAYERLPALAAELVALRVAAILAL
jgi:putative ABC transport system substrate-binding protein